MGLSTNKKFVWIDLFFYLPLAFVFGILCYGFVLVPTAIIGHKVFWFQIPIAVILDCIIMYFFCRAPISDYEEKNKARELKEIRNQ